MDVFSRVNAERVFATEDQRTSERKRDLFRRSILKPLGGDYRLSQDERVTHFTQVILSWIPFSETVVSSADQCESTTTLVTDSV
jgi:hypothetical protein